MLEEHSHESAPMGGHELWHYDHPAHHERERAEHRAYVDGLVQAANEAHTGLHERVGAAEARLEDLARRMEALAAEAVATVEGAAGDVVELPADVIEPPSAAAEQAPPAHERRRGRHHGRRR
jgi:hypothetical protein